MLTFPPHSSRLSTHNHVPHPALSSKWSNLSLLNNSLIQIDLTVIIHGTGYPRPTSANVPPATFHLVAHSVSTGYHSAPPQLQDNIRPAWTRPIRWTPGSKVFTPHKCPVTPQATPKTSMSNHSPPSSSPTSRPLVRSFCWRRLCTVQPAAYEAFFGFFAANSFVVREKGFSVRFLPCTGFGGIEGSYYATMAECARWPPRRGLETGLGPCHWENNSPMASTSTQPVAPRGSLHLSLHSVVQFPQYPLVKPLEKCFCMLHAGAWVLPSLELVD